MLTPDVLRTLIIVIPVSFFGFMLLSMLKRGAISSLSAGKDGVKIDMNAVDKRMESNYYLNRVIDEIDSTITYKLYRITLDTGRYLQKMIELKSGECIPATFMVYTEMRNVLYQALRENEFKTKLALIHRDEYLDVKMNELQEAYTVAIYQLAKEACRSGQKAQFPEWEIISSDIKAVIDEWGKSIAQGIIEGCNKKIEAYRHYREMFVQTKDSYFITVMDDCIEKNRRYIIALGGSA